MKLRTGEPTGLWRRVVAFVGVFVVVLCALVAAAGCGRSQQLTIVVSPVARRGDEPVTITVKGLPGNAKTDVSVTSTDATGTAWSSQASFTANAQGVVDTQTASSSAGSYLGVSAVGLITAMHTAAAASRPNLTYRIPASGASAFTVSAQSDGMQQTATFTRTFLPHPVSLTTLTLSHDHLSGVYAAPAQPTSRGDGILLLGGSEGGDSQVLLAQAFAARGIPALALAYFDAPGLPKYLADIPLEYFTTALRWLSHRSAVDPNRVWVSGASYGSEAALLLGSRYPNLVHGVLSLSGGNTVTCSLAPGGTLSTCRRPPFTIGGKPVPFTRQFNNASPTDVPGAVIPVEKITGPVLALCGGSDLEWNACQLSQTVLDRRRQDGTGGHDLLLSYPQAGHYIDFLLAYRPINTPSDNPNNGSTPQSNAQADADAWPKIIERITQT